MNSKGNILVVDDKHEFLTLLNNLLVNEDYTVFPVDSGELALVSIEKKIPDLIILDVQMPGIDGFEVCRRIKANNKFNHIPIIFLTSLADSSERIKGLRLGAVDYIIKPIEKEELLAKIDTHINLYRANKFLKEIIDNKEKEFSLLNLDYASINEEYLATNEELCEINLNLENLNKEIILAKEKAEQSEKRLRSTLDNMLEGCQIIGFDWRYLYINIVAEMHNQRPKEELLGNTYMEMWPGIENTEVFRIIKNCMEKREFRDFENEFYFPDGSSGWFLLKIQPVPEGVFILSVDITKRKLAEKALIQSEENYRLIADNANDWVYLIAPNGNMRYNSPSCERVTGYSPSEFYNNPQLIDQIVYQADKQNVANHKALVKEGNLAHEMEFRIVTKTGELRWIQHSCIPIYNQKGEYAGRRGTNHNITERRNAEEKEHLALARLRRFVDSGIVGVVIAETDGKIIETNDYYLNMLGYSRQEFESGLLDWRSITPPEWLHLDDKVIQELREKGISKPFEKEYFHRNGSRITVLIVDALLPGPDEQMVGFVLDITARKQMEKDLLDNNSRLKLAMQAANMAWWEMDIVNGSVTFDKRIAELLGYSPERIKCYTDFMALVHPDDYEAATNAMQCHIDGLTDKYELEYRILSESGEYNWFYNIGSIVKKDSNGKPQNMTGLVLDISDRMMAEEALRDSELRYRNLFENAPVGVFQSTDKGELILVNAEYASIFGYSSPDEMMQIVNSPLMTEQIFFNNDTKIKQINKALEFPGYWIRSVQHYLKKDGTKVTVNLAIRALLENPNLLEGFMEDISDQKRAEEALRRSEERYRSLLTNLEVGIVVHAPDTSIIMHNQRASELLGLSDDQMKGRLATNADWNFINENNMPLKTEEYPINRVLVSEKPFSNLVLGIIQSKTTEISWNTVNGFPVFDDNGEISEILISFIEITERVKAEEKLRESEKTFSEMFQKSPVTILLSVPYVGTIIDVNETFLYYTEYTRDEVIGRSTIELGIFEAMDDRDALINILKDKGQVFGYECSFRSKSGKTLTGLLSIVFVKIKGSICQLSSVIDISERKIAEKAIQENNTRLELAMEVANMAWWEMDLPSGNVIYNNRKAEMLGYSTEKFALYSDFMTLVHPDDKEGTMDAMQRHLDGFADKYETEYRILTKAGEYKWFYDIGSIVAKDSIGKPQNITGLVLDISKRRKAEEALRMSEDRYRNLLLNLEIGIVVYAPDKSIIMNNSRAEEMLGLSEEHFANRFIDNAHWRFIDENAIPFKIEEYPINQIISTKKTIKNLTVGVVRSTKNDITWLTVNGFPVFDKNGEIVEILVSYIEITERVKADEKLRESEKTFSGMFQKSPVTIILSVPYDGTILDVNETFLKEMHYSRDEVIGRTTLELGLFEDINERQNLVNILKEKGCVYGYECRFRTKNGIVVIGMLSIVFIKLKGAICQLSSVVDINALKQAQEALYRHSERLRILYKIDQAILKSIDSIEAIVHTALEPIRTLLNCQRATVGIFDLENKEVLIFASDVSNDKIIEIGKNLAEEAYGDIELMRKGKMEIVEDISQKVTPMTTNQALNVIGVQSFINVPLVSALHLYGVLNLGWENTKTFTDEEIEATREVASQITIAIEQVSLLKETKNYATRLEKRVRDRTTQLVIANKELESFAYSVSHDLRAPLRHIEGFSKLLKNELKNESAEALHFLDIISSSSLKMGTMIDSLLNFSRLGKQALQKIEIDLNDIISKIIKQFEPDIINRNIEWKIEELPCISADYRLISHVFDNLISNALKFTAKKEIAQIEIGIFDKTNETCTIFVKDNGAGFDPEFSDKLFGVFQRLHSNDEFEGIGIGLANVKQIIKKHGGSIRAEGKVNEGATFYITL